MANKTVLLLVFAVFAASVLPLQAEMTYSDRGRGESALKPVNLIVPIKLKTIPDEIQRGFHAAKGSKLEVYTIDLNCDKKTDYIVIGVADGDKEPAVVDTPDYESYPTYSYFLDSGFNIRYREDWRWDIAADDAFDFRWFARLDGGGMLYMFDMLGDSDSADYTLRKLNPRTWEPEVIFNFVPLIKSPANSDKKTACYGYPWDIQDLILSEKGGKTRVLSGMVPNDPDDPYNEDSGLPFIYFTGVPTQESDSSDMLKLAAYRTIAELEALYGKQGAAKGKTTP